MKRRPPPPAPTRSEPTDLITPGMLDAVSRVDFLTFVERVFAEVDPGTMFEPGWHLEMLASEMQAVAAGHCRRLIANVPPRSLKSIMASVALPAWMLGHDPTLKIMVVSYGQDLADDLARKTHQVMQSPWYRRIFPATILSASRFAASDFQTSRGGGRLGSSFGGPITGRGFDLIVIDDPIKPDEALSERVRKTVNKYVASTLRSRLNKQATGAMLVVMQRLHEDDLSGHLLTRGHWRHVSLPAIAETEEVWTYRTPFGLRTKLRKAGEALHPARDSLDVLAEIRSDMGAYLFAAQYQQRPAPLDGGIVQLSQFGRYTFEAPPSDFESIIQSWDTATKAGDANDYSVCTTWGRRGRHVWLLAVHRRKMEFPSLKKQVLELRAEWRPQRILIEDTASGAPLIQDLRHDGVWEITPIKPKGDKLMRLGFVSSKIEAGQVMLPHEAPWLATYEQEFMMFPNGRHDDQVDSTTQALAWITTSVNADGWLQMAIEANQRRAELRDGS